MKDKFIPILSVCTALFAILYAGYVYQVTGYQPCNCGFVNCWSGTCNSYGMELCED